MFFSPSKPAIAANKVLGIRAARCTSEKDAIAARKHNDANILCLREENGFNLERVFV